MMYLDEIMGLGGGGLTCPCGGSINKGALSGGRERWYCRACGRYEVMGEKNREPVGVRGEPEVLRGGEASV